jgi:SAM-dependent methyltransferase
MSFSPLVVWHDIECGHYSADLGLWDELAAREPGPVLDVGAGTGRVALTLAAVGYDVTALDREPELLAALASRPGGGRVRTVVADAAGFALDRRFGLILVPMQTIQLLPERAGFFASARAHLVEGGLLALAIAAALDDFGDLEEERPDPDVGAIPPWTFSSQPIAVRALESATRIERVRTTVGPDGAVTEEHDVIDLVNVTSAQLEAEGRAAGLTPEPARVIPETEEHVAAEVVLLRG